jgi:hypothetical protein
LPGKSACHQRQVEAKKLKRRANSVDSSAALFVSIFAVDDDPQGVRTFVPRPD